MAKVIEIIEVNREYDKPFCVFGSVDNVRGHEIEVEMLPWLVEHYNVIKVLHDGSMFELPALTEARRISLKYNQPVLYIHTRGAYNIWRTTLPTRRMWREEFGKKWSKYQEIVNDTRPTVACPFVDNNGTHRYNGFVANPAAWSLAKLTYTEDRMEYEHLWRGKDVHMVGTIIQSDKNIIKTIRQYLYKNFE